MATFSDGIGNYYIGNVSFSNFNPSFPNFEYTIADTLSNFTADLTSICTSAGLKFRNIVSQATIDAYLANPTLSTSPNLSRTLINFAAQEDNIDDRYGLGMNAGTSSVTSSGGCATLFNNSGSTNVTNAFNETANLLSRTSFISGSYGIGGGSLTLNFLKTDIGTLNTPIYYCGVANNQSLALYFCQQRFTNTSYQSGRMSLFVYAGIMSDVNTLMGRYNANIISKSILFTGGRSTFADLANMPIINSRHYIDGASQTLLELDVAQYPITGTDGTSQSCSHAYVFDIDPSRSDPCMGRAPNLMLANYGGLYKEGRPVKVLSCPDAGHNSWIPVGIFARKVMLMRCYSTQT